MELLRLEGKRALVAGGSGFVGSHVAERLRAEGCKVRVTHHSNDIPIPTDDLEVLRTDLRDENACRQATKDMDYVFMCAAVTSGAAVIRGNPLAHVTPNVLLNTQMLDAAYNAGVERFLFISTSAAYPPAGDHPLQEDEMFTDDPHPVYYPAGWMKRYTETLCRTYAKDVTPNMTTVVVRPSNIYGPRDKFDPERSHVTAAMIRKVFERQSPIEVWGTGEDVRDLIYIDNFVEGLIRAFRHPSQHYVVNIGSGRSYAVRDILKTAINVGGFAEAKITYLRDKPRTIPIMLIDTSRAEQDLGFKAAVDLETGFGRTFEWLQQSSHKSPAT